MLCIIEENTCTNMRTRILVNITINCLLLMTVLCCYVHKENFVHSVKFKGLCMKFPNYPKIPHNIGYDDPWCTDSSEPVH